MVLKITGVDNFWDENQTVVLILKRDKCPSYKINPRGIKHRADYFETKKTTTQ